MKNNHILYVTFIMSLTTGVFNISRAQCPSGCTEFTATTFSFVPGVNYCVPPNTTLVTTFTGTYLMNNNTLCIGDGADLQFAGSFLFQINTNLIDIGDNATFTLDGSITHNTGTGGVTIGSNSVYEICGASVLNDNDITLNGSNSILITRGSITSSAGGEVSEDLYWIAAAAEAVLSSNPDCGPNVQNQPACINNGAGDPFPVGFTSEPPGTSCGQAIDIQNALAAAPIELNNFSATVTKDAIELEWQTASEVNNEYFEIQHRTYASDFEVIGKVEGQGNSTDIVNYSFTHEAPKAGTNYYRLNQIDFDGSSDISPIASAFMDSAKGDEFAIYNNNNSLTVLGVESDSEFRIIDFNGRKVTTGILDSSNKVDIQGIQSGYYIILLQNGNDKLSKQFAKF